MKPSGNILFNVRRIRVELTRHFWHYLLRVARLPSRTDTPFLALPPESSASTNFATCASKVDAKI